MFLRYISLKTFLTLYHLEYPLNRTIVWFETSHLIGLGSGSTSCAKMRAGSKVRAALLQSSWAWGGKIEECSGKD